MLACITWCRSSWSGGCCKEKWLQSALVIYTVIQYVIGVAWCTVYTWQVHISRACLLFHECADIQNMHTTALSFIAYFAQILHHITFSKVYIKKWTFINVIILGNSNWGNHCTCNYKWVNIVSLCVVTIQINCFACLTVYCYNSKSISQNFKTFYNWAVLGLDSIVTWQNILTWVIVIIRIVEFIKVKILACIHINF